ncbi:MAG TPA: fumarylacetoacetate hydrolase family protein [Gammaproteobacteria bacterium]|nr:fumarylacetoacetate hydrolase family protein [Gammaproteobacteria bacterium]
MTTYSRSPRVLLAVMLGVAAAVAGAVPLPTAAQPSVATFRLLTFVSGASGPRLGATRGDGEQDVVDVHNAIVYLYGIDAPELEALPPIPIDMRALIEAGDAPLRGVRTVHDAVGSLRDAGTFTEPGGTRRVFHPPTAIEYLPPITDPSKIMSLAGAYQRRAPDGTPGTYDDVEYLSFFFKSPASLTGHDAEINLWGLLTTGVYEPEFAIVIGKTARAVSAAEALDYVVGYTMMNDVSSRDLPQGQHGQQGGSMSKSLDTFTPLGPYLTLKEDVPDPNNVDVSGSIDGELHVWPVPNGNTSFLTFTVEETIAYLSERMTLLPGDVIATGVPQPTMTFAEGQVVEVEIGNLGTQRNRVVSNPIPGHTPIAPRAVGR